MARIFITGISGTGKTTIYNELQKHGHRAISLDEYPALCRWQNKATGQIVDYKAVLDKDFITSHEWICDTAKLKELLKEADDPVFVLGMAGNQEELLPLFDTVLLLACPPEIFIKRIMQRSDNDFGKEESAQEYILETYQEFEKRMIQRGAIRIDATGSISKVIQSVLLAAAQ